MRMFTQECVRVLIYVTCWDRHYSVARVRHRLVSLL